jgi:hypothetical protein
MYCHEGQPEWIDIVLEPHGGIRGRCSQCQRPAPGYDRLPERRWSFVPLWGIPTYFCYAPRRVECGQHGVVVEHIPWSDGKRAMTCAMMGFLARWARRLSWRETAQVFLTSWESVYRSVEWFGSSRQGCESSRVRVPTPSITCIRTVSISGAC